MRHQHHVLPNAAGACRFEGLAKVQGDLVAHEIEIDLGFSASAFLAA